MLRITPKGVAARMSRDRIRNISIKRGKALARRGYELFAVKTALRVAEMKASEEFVELVEELQDIFATELPSKSPPKRKLEFEAKLQTDQPPPVRPATRLSAAELQELKKQLQELLTKGLIRPSTSP